MVGARAVKKHIFGRVVNRKRPLEEYADFSALPSVQVPDRCSLLTDLRYLHTNHHSIGLLQVLDSSTDTASSEEEDTTCQSLTREEVVMKRLQVTFSISYYVGGVQFFHHDRRPFSVRDHIILLIIFHNNGIDDQIMSV